MACGACVPFSKLFSPTPAKELASMLYGHLHFIGQSVRTQRQVIPAEASSLGRFLWKTTFTIVMNSPNSISWHGLKIALVSGHDASLPIPTRHVYAPATSCLTLVCDVHEVIICGYWMGPDIEDGWGYVEAYVYPCF